MTYITSLERTIARQRSRVRWIKEGDANTKLFHAITNRRRTKNFIPALKHGEDIIMDHSRKEEVFFDMYNNLPGSIQIREHSLDLDTLGLPTHDLRELGNMISEDEVFVVIKEMPADRARPGRVYWRVLLTSLSSNQSRHHGSNSQILHRRRA